MGSCCVPGTNHPTNDLEGTGASSTLDDYYRRESHKKIEAVTKQMSTFAPPLNNNT